MAFKLNNSLLEMVAVIGLDESTALIPADPERYSGDQLQDIDGVSLCPQILAAVSGQVALFPPISPRPDDTYPPTVRRSPSRTELPQKKSTGPQGLNGRGARIKGSRERESGVAALKRRLTKRCSSFRQLDFARVSEADESTVVRVTELPLNAETLTSLTTLCFPDDCFVYADESPDTLRYFVLTDIVGSRTYAVSLCCYTKYFAYKDSCGLWKVSADLDPEDDADPKKKKVPTATLR